MKSRHSCLAWIIVALVVVGIALAIFFFIPSLAVESFGQPHSSIGAGQRLNYSLELLLESGDLTVPCDPQGAGQVFVIQEGETVQSIARRLEQAGIVCDAKILRDYLVWSGLDTTIRAGTYRLSPAMTGQEVAQALQDPTPTESSIVVFSGWRLEEIADSLSSTGLGIAREDFILAANLPLTPPSYLPAGASAEGFLAPGEYTLPRTTTAPDLVAILMQNFDFQLTPDLLDAYAGRGLGVYQAVTLASLIEREALYDDEMPTIASVFFNRLMIGMSLQSDPTVQYALGWTGDSWWKAPLSLSDLEAASPYNTYLHPGLPPAPICNPGLAALQAVAFPAQTNYYFFSAMCDGSGYHNFAETFEQQLENLCP